MTETIQEMENRWAGLMAARYGTGHPRAGERIYECDGKYQREVMALRTQIEERKAAESARPQINQDQLAWLDRLQAASDPDGRRPAQEMSQKGTAFRKNLTDARRDVLAGKSLPASLIAETESAIKTWYPPKKIKLKREDGTEVEKEETVEVSLPTPVARPTKNHRDRDGNIIGDTRLAPPAVDLSAPMLQSINTGRNRQA